MDAHQDDDDIEGFLASAAAQDAAIGSECDLHFGGRVRGAIIGIDDERADLALDATGVAGRGGRVLRGGARGAGRAARHALDAAQILLAQGLAASTVMLLTVGIIIIPWAIVEFGGRRK